MEWSPSIGGKSSSGHVVYIGFIVLYNASITINKGCEFEGIDQ